ncbi:hypothetical protein FCOIX_11278 [Fusarium coicis]|nr:hypothetical protein FCOIX_11278 [Fusarium coicis]
MRVHTTLGPLILSAGLCAARACAPHPRSTTATSSWSSETDTATAVASTTTEIATTTISGVASEQTTTTAESDSAVETSVTVSTSAFETSTLESSTLESSTLQSTTFQVSTSAAEASTHTTAYATTTTTSPAQSSTGTTAVLVRGLACYQGNQCADLPGPYSGNTAKICQRVDIQQGYEYTFAAHLRQGCTYRDAGEGEDLDCYDNINSVKLSIDGVFDSEAKPVGNYQYYEYSSTFQYPGASIDSTDLCVSVIINQGDRYEFVVDSVSLVRGKSVPIPEET